MRILGLILVVIIVVGAIYSFVVWIAGELDFASIFSRPDTSSSQRESVSVEKEDSRVSLQFEKPSGLREDIPAGFTEDDISPDFGKVEITSIRRPSSAIRGGGFTLKADFTLNEPIDITNWRIKSNRGEVAIFGAFLASGPVNRERIVLRPRTSAVFYAGLPSFVKNVELNKCTGYLNTIYNTNPELPNNCPRPSRSEIISFSGECQRFIRSLSSCELPTSEELNRFTRPADISCHEFLEDLNYGNCVSDNLNDPSFYSYGWRVWIDGSLPFDFTNDRLLLFDEEGLLVEERIY